MHRCWGSRRASPTPCGASPLHACAIDLLLTPNTLPPSAHAIACVCDAIRSAVPPRGGPHRIPSAMRPIAHSASSSDASLRHSPPHSAVHAAVPFVISRARSRIAVRLTRCFPVHFTLHRSRDGVTAGTLADASACAHSHVAERPVAHAWVANITPLRLRMHACTPSIFLALACSPSPRPPPPRRLHVPCAHVAPSLRRSRHSVWSHIAPHCGSASGADGTHNGPLLCSLNARSLFVRLIDQWRDEAMSVRYEDERG